MELHTREIVAVCEFAESRSPGVLMFNGMEFNPQRFAHLAVVLVQLDGIAQSEDIIQLAYRLRVAMPWYTGYDDVLKEHINRILQFIAPPQ